MEYSYNGNTPKMVYKHTLDSKDSFEKLSIPQIKLKIQNENFQIVDFRPAQKGEYYFDAMSGSIELWDLKYPELGPPRFIVIPKSVKKDGSAISNILNNEGYKLVVTKNDNDWVITLNFKDTNIYTVTNPSFLEAWVKMNEKIR